MKDYSKQKEEAREAYRHMLDHFLNEIKQVDYKTPWQETEPQWWLDMMEIEKLVRAKSDGMR